MLGPRADLTMLAALPRCRKPDGAPMADVELCWTSREASIAGTALARLIVADARVRACLEAAARVVP